MLIGLKFQTTWIFIVDISYTDEVPPCTQMWSIIISDLEVAVGVLKKAHILCFMCSKKENRAVS